MTALLHIVATPIGNLDDMTPRGVQALREADVIACEDTRRTRILLSHFQIPTPRFLLSYRQGNEERVGEQLLDFVAQGKRVALCSDGGYPGVSDPGYRLVSMAAERGVDFDVLPGASAVDLALLSSGLPTSSYTFKGYAPRKEGALKRFFEEEKERPHTLIVFESPFRIEHALRAALQVLGDRQAAVCIELTKKFERIARGFLSDLCRQFEGQKVKGEVTLVIAGNHPKFCRESTCPDAECAGLPGCCGQAGQAD